MMLLERIDVFQFYPPETKFENKYCCQYKPMYMFFGLKRQDLCHKARLVVGVHVVDSTEHTTYSSTIKNVSVRIMLLIAVKNGLELMDGDIGNSLCMAPCAENSWSCCAADSGNRFGGVVVLKQALCVLNIESNSFHKYFGDFIRYVGFTSSIIDQDLWIHNCDEYEVYE